MESTLTSRSPQPLGGTQALTRWCASTPLGIRKGIMKTSNNNRSKHLHVFCISALLCILSGCATISLWSDDNPKYNYELVATATGTEMVAESNDKVKEYAQPEITLSYTDTKYVNSNKNHPPTQSGCLVLTQLDDSLRLLSGLESFLRTPEGSNVYSVKAVINHDNFKQLRGAQEYQFRLGLAFKTADDATLREKIIPMHDGIWAPLLKGRPVQGSIKHYSEEGSKFNTVYAQLDSFIIDGTSNDMSYFLVGGPSGGGPSGMTSLTFKDDCTTPSHISLLPKNNLPFTILFVDKTAMRRFPLPVLIVLTPFSIAFNIVTSPVQLLMFATAEYWMPRY